MKKGQVKNLADSGSYLVNFLGSNFFHFFPCRKRLQQKLASAASENLQVGPATCGIFFLASIQFLPVTNVNN